jgi:hypothetical protein
VVDTAEKVTLSAHPCFATRFACPFTDQNVETTTIAESPFVTDLASKTKVALHVLKGYASQGESEWLAAGFALPKGMSGAPHFVTESDAQYVARVLWGRQDEKRSRIKWKRWLTKDMAQSTHISNRYLESNISQEAGCSRDSAVRGRSCHRS